MEKQYAVYREDNAFLVGVIREEFREGIEISSQGLGIPVRYESVSNEEATRLREEQITRLLGI